jgi:hypothetical protein
VLIAQGGAFGGWALYATDGRLTYCQNLFGLQRFKVAGDRPIPAGSHQVRMEFDYDGGGPGKGGLIRLSIDGEQVGEGRLPATVPLTFSVDETADLGRDTASPVSDDYTPEEGVFTGIVNGSRSTSAPMTTSSAPRSGSGSRWRASERGRLPQPLFLLIRVRPAATERAAKTRVSTALELRSMVRMGSPVRFRRGAPRPG